MSAYKDALRLSSTERGARLTAAAELLAERKAVVVLDNTLALRPDAHRILCEVIASDGIAPEEQVEMALTAQHPGLHSCRKRQRRLGTTKLISGGPSARHSDGFYPPSDPAIG